jgi:hypothetical protein
MESFTQQSSTGKGKKYLNDDRKVLQFDYLAHGEQQKGSEETYE